MPRRVAVSLVAAALWAGGSLPAAAGRSVPSITEEPLASAVPSRHEIERERARVIQERQHLHALAEDLRGRVELRLQVHADAGTDLRQRLAALPPAQVAERQALEAELRRHAAEAERAALPERLQLERLERVESLRLDAEVRRIQAWELELQGQIVEARDAHAGAELLAARSQERRAELALRRTELEIDAAAREIRRLEDEAPDILFGARKTFLGQERSRHRHLRALLPVQEAGLALARLERRRRELDLQVLDRRDVAAADPEGRLREVTAAIADAEAGRRALVLALAPEARRLLEEREGLAAGEVEARAAAAHGACQRLAAPRTAACDACADALRRFLGTAEQQLAACLEQAEATWLFAADAAPRAPRERARCLAAYEGRMAFCGTDPGPSYRAPVAAVAPGFERGLARAGGCDGLFWAADRDATLALVVSVPPVGSLLRLGALPYADRLRVGREGVAVELHQGRALDRWCGEALEVSPYPRRTESHWTAVSGTIHVEAWRGLDLPAGPAEVTLELSNVVLRSHDDPQRTVALRSLQIRTAVETTGAAQADGRP